ncbi:MAG: hypothetical protein M3417_03285 [Actinomycetota bacterium]|nr:hypothetical protein [Actinomycetota bacterium]
MAWLRWGALNLGLLGIVMVGGLLLLVPAAIVGWGTTESRQDAYLYLWIYLPFTGVAYLVLLALMGRRARRPRIWALVLTPVFWGSCRSSRSASPCPESPRHGSPTSPTGPWCACRRARRSPPGTGSDAGRRAVALGRPPGRDASARRAGPAEKVLRTAPLWLDWFC